MSQPKTVDLQNENDFEVDKRSTNDFLDDVDEPSYGSPLPSTHTFDNEEGESLQISIKKNILQVDPLDDFSVDNSKFKYEDRDTDRLYDKGELTFRAIIVGCLIGGLVGAMNINFGLRTGWTQGGSIFAAIIAIGVFKIINPIVEYTKWEAVITVTTASSAGAMSSAAGLVSSIPALKLLGRTYSIWELYLWGFSIAYFGIFFAIPLRRQMIIVEKLRFPSGTATAETIKAMFAKTSATVQKAKVLVYVAIGTSIFSLLAFFVPYLEEPPVPKFFRTWGLILYINPLLIGGGMLSGFRASASLFGGTVVGWYMIGSFVHYYGWASGAILSFSGVRGWILWVGVAIMTSDSIVQLLFSFHYIVKGVLAVVNRIRDYAQSKRRQDHEDYHLPEKYLRVPKQTIPMYYWTIGLVISTVVLCTISHFIFNLKFYFVLFAIPLSALLSLIAVRCAGETDINPVGSMGKVSQLVYAGLAPGQIETNLLSASIIAAGASQCGDMMQDLKTGYIMKVSPKSQFWAQCIGVVFGLLFTVPIYKLYDMAYHVGGEEVPAPAAHAWKAVAEILAKGMSALPKYSIWGIVGGCVFGAFLGFASRTMTLTQDVIEYVTHQKDKQNAQVTEDDNDQVDENGNTDNSRDEQGLAKQEIGTERMYKYTGGFAWNTILPSALAFGIGMIIPPKQSITMFIGAVMQVIWKLTSPNSNKNYFFAVSSGLIAGEGLMGIMIAILKILGVQPLFQPIGF